ncbi:hypothetical protein NEUTE1DRAFT_99001 [Neurospora tetrasperma FGSC 2508]|uniref:Uncharacterized protein n=1 Tax=Neurospora tetrasperma (strain FGSC 2508 / ATCC MYA-4615 / P0657) TaxID=510951 RepID=F8MHI9_NEUT8|nr:uncharacterized protein NEUTE1DRAFT_99001 [Neurospora tetrasperma FGSC 2508]EGO58801.1 hypothetical protein NEUTE1DRAFT_99001 [Neurospora tetrasperma FGSC 2508]EGZ72901.1 hypothetical protein NEUTE2DRAFT_61814 [Neurospora tetrasperma FGSC 2509]
MDLRHFFVTFLFVVCTWAAKNTDEVREFIYDNRDNKTVLNEEPAPPWVSSPTVRGTGDIIISCLVTLIACAYTAIHPTVPPGGSGKRSFTLIKAALVLVALMCPEAVFALAFQVYLDARRLKKTLKGIIKKGNKEALAMVIFNKIIKTNEKGNQVCERKDLLDESLAMVNEIIKTIEKSNKEAMAMVDMKFCYFVVMGGLQVDISDIKPSDHVQFYFHGHNMPETLPLSADGVIELAKLGPGYLEKLLVEPAVIEDKSKGALVQKCVVLVQVAWMGIQCIARKAAGYPVSLLELHTFGHVLVAMLLYLCWLKKPLDVRQPVFVNPADFKDEPTREGFQDALALMVQEQFCDLQNLTGFLNLKWKQEKLDKSKATREEDGRNSTKEKTALIVVNQMAQESTPLPTPADQPDQYMGPGKSTTGSQDSVLSVPIEEVDVPSGNPETFDLGINQYLPCGVGHMPVSQEPNWKCIWTGADNWRVDLRKASGFDRREEDKFPIRLTRADRRRAERAARHIKVVEELYRIDPVEQPEPYAYKRHGSSGQHCRYTDLGYRRAFQTLKFEVDKLNPLAVNQKGGAQHDSENSNPETIDANRRKLLEEVTPRLIIRYAAFLDATFSGFSKTSYFVCVMVGASVGAIHLAAWDSVFPTRVESIIWRIASLLMMATVPVGLCYRFQIIFIQRYNFQHFRLGYQTSRVWLVGFLAAWYFFLIIISIVVFVTVRGYLIVESFISVRYMAYGVYFVPDWLQIFPHI